MQKTKSFQAIHNILKFNGKTQNELLNTHPALFEYLSLILKDKIPKAPTCSVDEWKTFLNVLKDHGIEPLIYWKTSALPPENQPPEEILEFLRRIYLFNVKSNLLMEKHITALVNELDKKNIPSLLFKGLAVAQLYKNPSTRVSGDIDILLPNKHIPAVHKLLTETGFRCTRESYLKFRNTFHANEYMRREGKQQVLIDLHWRLYEKFGLFEEKSFEDYFKTAEKRAFGHALGLIDMFLYLTYHLILHHSTALRLIWIYDLKEVLERIIETKQIDQLKKACIASNLIIATQHMVKLLELWTAIKIPKKFSDDSTWPKPHKREAYIWKHCINRNNSVISWLILFWPKGIRFSEGVKLFFNLVSKKSFTKWVKLRIRSRKKQKTG